MPHISLRSKIAINSTMHWKPSSSSSLKLSLQVNDKRVFRPHVSFLVHYEAQTEIHLFCNAHRSWLGVQISGLISVSPSTVHGSENETFSNPLSAKIGVYE